MPPDGKRWLSTFLPLRFNKQKRNSALWLIWSGMLISSPMNWEVPTISSMSAHFFALSPQNFGQIMSNEFVNSSVPAEFWPVYFFMVRKKMDHPTPSPTSPWLEIFSLDLN